MGIGRYRNGVFDLVVSFLYSPSRLEQSRWRECFKYASGQLQVATHGQMRFGVVRFGFRANASQEADVFIVEGSGSSRAHVNARGLPGLPIYLQSAAITKPLILVHEFAHYAFGLHDEYTGTNGKDSECTGNPKSGACIMEFTEESDTLRFRPSSHKFHVKKGPVKFFCNRHDHNLDNAQHQQNKESCWQTMARNYPDLVIPTGLEVGVLTAVSSPVSFRELAERQRFALVLDKSPDRESFGVIMGFRSGAEFWIDALESEAEFLRIVLNNRFFACDSSFEAGVGNWGEHKGMIAWSSLGENAGLIEALRRSLVAVQDAESGRSGGDDSSRIIILVSDGEYESRSELDGMIERLVDDRVRVFCLGVGLNADHEILNEVAQRTGGRFERINDEPRVLDVQRRIQNFFIEMLADVVEDVGLIAVQEKQLSHFPHGEKQPRRMPAHEQKRSRRRRLLVREDGTGIDVRFFVEAESQRAIFVLSSRADHQLDLSLVDPDHTRWRKSSEKDGVEFRQGPGYIMVDVAPEPAQGFWTVELRRLRGCEAVDLTIMAFSVNRNVHTGIRGHQSLYAVDETITLFATADFEDSSLPGAPRPIAVQVRHSDSRNAREVLGAWHPERLLHDPIDTAHRQRSGIVFRGTLSFWEPGSYPIIVELVDPVSRSIGFMRTRRFQVHIGPLSSRIIP